MLLYFDGRLRAFQKLQRKANVNTQKRKEVNRNKRVYYTNSCHVMKFQNEISGMSRKPCFLFQWISLKSSVLTLKTKKTNLISHRLSNTEIIKDALNSLTCKCELNCLFKLSLSRTIKCIHLKKTIKIALSSNTKYSLFYNIVKSTKNFKFGCIYANEHFRKQQS